MNLFVRSRSFRCLVARVFLITAVLAVLPGSALAAEGGVAISRLPVSLAIKGECRGSTFLGVVDTGTPETFIDASATDLYGEFISTLPSPGVEEPHVMKVCEGIPLSLGGQRLALSPVCVASLEGVMRGTGLPLQAIIGVRSLRFSRLWLNHSTGRLQLASIDEAAEMDSWKSTPMIKPVDIVHVRLPLAGDILNFVVDTGDNGSISLEYKEFQRLVEQGVIEPSADAVTISFDAVGKKEAEKSGTFRKGEFMGVPLAGHDVGATAANAIGLKWLFQLDCLFDFPAAEVRYRPRVDAPNPVDLAPLLGAALSFEPITHEARVEAIMAGSVLAQAGIKQGDKLVKFGNLTGADMNVIRLAEYVQALPPDGVPITVRNKADGQMRDMKVKFARLPRILDLHEAGTAEAER